MKKKPKIVDSEEDDFSGDGDGEFRPSPPPPPPTTIPSSSSSALPALPPLKKVKEKERGGKESDSFTPVSNSFERDRKGKGKERGRDESDREGSGKDGGRGQLRKRPKIESGGKEGGGSSTGAVGSNSGTPRGEGGVKARITSELVGVGGERKVGTPIGAGGEGKKVGSGVGGGEKKKEAGGFSLSSFLTVRPSYSTLDSKHKRKRRLIVFCG